MKKSSITQSAFTSFRIFLAFTLCLAGLSLAASALGAWPGVFAGAWIAAEKQAAYKAKVDAKIRKSSGAISAPATVKSSSGPTASSNPATPGQPDNSAQNTVTRQTNSLGQTVYSIAPSRFDVSKPLTELAKLSLPQPPEEQHAEPKLPPWRIPRSTIPDPVTQVAPA